MERKYSFNIIHDIIDTSFAKRLSESLSYKFKVKNGFCSYQRRSGQFLMQAATEEIKASGINICIVQPNVSETIRSIFQIAVFISQREHQLDQLIFVAYNGISKTDIQNTYCLLTGDKIIEFAMENDPMAMNLLHQSVQKLLPYSHFSSHNGTSRLTQNMYSYSWPNQPSDLHDQKLPVQNRSIDERHRNEYVGIPTNEISANISTVPLAGSDPVSLYSVMDEHNYGVMQPSENIAILPSYKNNYHHDQSLYATGIQPSDNMKYITNSFDSIDIRAQSRQCPVLHATEANVKQHDSFIKSQAAPGVSTKNVREVVFKIGNELDKAEFSSLKFYFNGTISEDIMEVSDPLDILDQLLFQEIVTYKCPGILIDCLILLDRNDLAEQLKKACGIFMENSWEPRNIYTNMLYKFASEIDDNDLRKLKAHLTGTSFKGKKKHIEDCKSAMDLVCVLENEGEIRKHNCKYDIEESCIEYTQTYNYLIRISEYLNCQAQIQDYVNNWFLQFNEAMYVDGPEESLKSNYLDERSLNELRKCFLKEDLSLKVDDEGLKYMSYKKMLEYIDHKNRFVLGKGGFGTVYKAVEKYKGIDVAIKKNNDMATKKQLVNEKAIAHVKHPFLLPLIAVTEDNQNGMFMLMYPLMNNGDLAKRLDGKERLNSRDYIRVLWQTSCAIAFLHIEFERIRRPIRHGDIKPSNILLDENLNARLGDTGLALEMDFGKSHYTNSNTAGTFTYRDPDITYNEEGNPQLKPANDIYSFGIVIAQVLLHTSEQTMHSIPVQVGRKGWGSYLHQNYDKSVWNQKECHDLTMLVKMCVEEIKERHNSQNIKAQLKKIHNVDVLEPKLKKEKCVQCLVNMVFSIPATCGCMQYCQTCFKTAFRNPLDCPKCLSFTEPPIGHSNYFALLIGAPDSRTTTFIRDMDDVYRTITDPHVMGIRAQNIYRMCDKNSGKDHQWKATKENIDEVFGKLEKRFSNAKGNVTLIIYISCHADKERFQLGHGEFMKRSELKTKLKRLRFKYLLLVCDCCYSGNTSVPSWIDLEDNSHDKEQVNGHTNESVEGPVKCNSDRQDVTFHHVKTCDDPCIYQLASCGRMQKSFFVNGSSLFTQYFISGLRSGHSCKLVHDKKFKDCDICKKFRKKNTEYITVSSLHEYIHDHMMEDKDANGQKANKKEESNDSLKLAYYNPNKPMYSVKFQYSLLHDSFEAGTRILELDRHPMSYGGMKYLKNHLWEQLEMGTTRYKELNADFLQVGFITFSNGKEVFREEDKIDVEKFRQYDAYCQIRSDTKYLFKERPIACEIDYRESSQFKVFLENPHIPGEYNCIEEFKPETYPGSSYSCTITLKKDHQKIFDIMEKKFTKVYENATKVFELLKKVPNRDDHFSGIIKICIFERLTTLQIL